MFLNILYISNKIKQYIKYLKKLVFKKNFSLIKKANNKKNTEKTNAKLRVGRLTLGMRKSPFKSLISINISLPNVKENAILPKLIIWLFVSPPQKYGTIITVVEVIAVNKFFISQYALQYLEYM